MQIRETSKLRATGLCEGNPPVTWINYADDNHICNENEFLELLKDHTEKHALTAMNWFDKNQTTANADKFQSILLSRDSTGDFIVSVCGHDLNRGNTLKILGVTLDY